MAFSWEITTRSWEDLSSWLPLVPSLFPSSPCPLSLQRLPYWFWTRPTILCMYMCKCHCVCICMMSVSEYIHSCVYPYIHHVGAYTHLCTCARTHRYTPTPLFKIRHTARHTACTYMYTYVHTCTYRYKHMHQTLFKCDRTPPPTEVYDASSSYIWCIDVYILIKCQLCKAGCK